MLEWLSSKLAITIAAMLLLSSVTAHFLSQRDCSLEMELGNVARAIASFVDIVLDLSGEGEFLVGCDNGVSLAVPSEIGGFPYDIQLRRDSVILSQDRRTAISHWHGELHFWQAPEGRIDFDDVQRWDVEFPSLKLVSCQRFHIALDGVLIDGSPSLFAFAHASD